MDRPQYSPLWGPVHLFFKSVQAVSLLTVGPSFVYFRFYKGSSDVMGNVIRVSGHGMTYAVPAFTLALCAYLWTAKETYPPRAERFAKNWRQLLCDASSFVGALGGLALLPGSNTVGKLGVGAAAGTLLYISAMPVLPHYDSKDWTKDLPKPAASTK